MKSFGRLSLAASAWCLPTSAALADVQEYCGAYARDVTNGRLSGGEIFNGKVAGTTPETSAKWNAVNAQALAGCLAQYGASVGEQAEAVTAAAVVSKATSKPRRAAKTPATARRRSSSKTAGKPRPAELTRH